MLDVLGGRFERHSLDPFAVPSFRCSLGDLSVDVSADAKDLHKERGPDADGVGFYVVEFEYMVSRFRTNDDFPGWKGVSIEWSVCEAWLFDDVA